MLATSRAPGVHYEALDASAPSSTPLRTDVAGFVGLAERGPLDVPVPIESWQQFHSWFGGLIPQGLLGYAVRGFLENGGHRCWVVRVASTDPLVGAAPAVTTLADPLSAVWRVRASSPGEWGNDLSLSAREQVRAQVHAIGADDRGRWSAVPVTSGFAAGSLVRISRPGGGPPAWHRVALVDAVAGRLHWTHPDPEHRSPGERPLADPEPDLPLLLESVDYRLLVSERGRLLQVYDHLSLVPGTPRYGPVVLAPVPSPLEQRTGRTVSGAAGPPPRPVVVEELRPDPTVPTGLLVDAGATLRLAGGRPGLASLTLRDLIGEPLAADDSDVVVADKLRGLRALEQVREVALLAFPDLQVEPVAVLASAPPPPCVPDPCLDPPAAAPAAPTASSGELPPVLSEQVVFSVQSEMVGQCERLGDRFALLDLPRSTLTPTAGVRGVLDWRSRFDTSYASLTHPWLLVDDPLQGQGGLRLLPPSGHVAGLVAASDRAVGVHRAPANRPVRWALGAAVDLSAEHHAILNESGVNALRTVAGRGLRLLGARTLSSDADWRYVNVRRLMSMIETALEISLQWAVFEPNGVLTRARATMSVTVLLDGLHEAGMLAGRTAEESFFVQCDLDNNPVEERDLGRLLVEVGVAPSQPFEFVLLRVGRVLDSVVVQESQRGSFPLAGTGR